MQTQQNNRRTIKALAAATAIAGCAMVVPAQAGDWSANAAMTSNYVWRGLTQTENEAAVQGGIDYASDSGFYMGTWVSNVNYGAGDAYSYEHDVYAGFAFETGDISWDVGYLYYNYDGEANFDFGEVYASVGLGGLSATVYVLANTQADPTPDQDFDFGSTYYASLDYSFDLGNDVGLGVHVGFHDGDFAEAFNGTDDGYYDASISVSKGGFAFTVSDTDAGGIAAEVPYQNSDPRFYVSYAVDIDL